MEEAVARCKDKAFVSKPSQDFLRRVVQTSGVSDATAQPEGAQGPLAQGPRVQIACALLPA